MEIFLGRTEDFNLTYVSWNWGLYIISDKIEDFLENNSDIMIGIQIELSHIWKSSGDFSDKTEDFI